jgi:hypothetical protein
MLFVLVVIDEVNEILDVLILKEEEANVDHVDLDEGVED